MNRFVKASWFVFAILIVHAIALGQQRIDPIAEVIDRDGDGACRRLNSSKPP